MSTNPALDVRCLHCGSAPGAVCLGTTWPGKGQESRRPMRFSPAHPVRVALAAALAAGASQQAAERAARIAVRSDHHDYEIPYLADARLAVERADIEVARAYRKQHPPGPGLPEPAQPELDLQ